MIFIALMLGLILHWRPIRYVRAFNCGARTVGPILLQFPLYGGIMGMMTGTGLAAVISQAFVAFSTQDTLPFWSFVSSNIISLFVPSGGGHWAVQGPFMVPAAVDLNVDPAMTAMAIAMGEQTANMIQPFWALADPCHRRPRHQGHHGLLRDGALRRSARVRCRPDCLCLERTALLSKPHRCRMNRCPLSSIAAR